MQVKNKPINVETPMHSNNISLTHIDSTLVHYVRNGVGGSKMVIFEPILSIKEQELLAKEHNLVINKS